MNFLSQISGWLIDPKNRSLQALLVVIILILLLLRQCNVSSSLRADIQAAHDEAVRVDNNHLADVDSIKQSYSKKTGELTAEISGHLLTIDELNGKYKELYGDYLNEKGKEPITIIKYRFLTKELITGVDIESTPIDSMGNGSFSFCDSTQFSAGNSRMISGTIPYKLSLHTKADSALLDYSKQAFFTRAFPGAGNFQLQQEMSVNTGLTKDTETGEVKVWAKTSYPGVTFELLKGASIKEDEETKKTLASLRKTWGLGFSVGAGAVYTGAAVTPGIFAGVGLNYSPKKLQFGK
jgi:hypothetical protein